MPKDMQHRDRSTDLGVVRINNEAITAMASIAAMEVRGVCRMGSSLGKSVMDVIIGRSGSRGVKIKMTEGEVALTVSIVTEYGISVPRVADEVQENVKRAIEKMTGLVLSEVDVVVEGVHVRQEKKV